MPQDNVGPDITSGRDAYVPAANVNQPANDIFTQDGAKWAQFDNASRNGMPVANSADSRLAQIMGNQQIMPSQDKSALGALLLGALLSGGAAIAQGYNGGGNGVTATATGGNSSSSSTSSATAPVSQSQTQQGPFYSGGQPIHGPFYSGGQPIHGPLQAPSAGQGGYYPEPSNAPSGGKGFATGPQVRQNPDGSSNILWDAGPTPGFSGGVNGTPNNSGYNNGQPISPDQMQQGVPGPYADTNSMPAGPEFMTEQGRGGYDQPTSSLPNSDGVIPFDNSYFSSGPGHPSLSIPSRYDQPAQQDPSYVNSWDYGGSPTLQPYSDAGLDSFLNDYGSY